MKPEVHIVHGIMTKNVPWAFQKVAGEVYRSMGFKVVEHSYPWMTGLFTRHRNEKIAEKLYDEIPNGSIYVGHSNGCTLGWKLAQMGKEFTGVVFIQPALDRDKIIYDADWVHVYCNPEDKTVWLSKILINHDWGNQGQEGPLNPPDHYEVIWVNDTDGMPEVIKHSWYNSYDGRKWLYYSGEQVIISLEKTDEEWS